MFGGNNNNNGVNVNTHFITLYSEEYMMSLGGWNRSLSIKLHPAVGKDANGVIQYTQELAQIVKTSLRFEKAKILFDKYEKVVKPKVGTSDPASISVEVSSNNINKILTIKWDGTDAYFIVSIVDTNKKATNEYKHKFAKKEYIENYDSETGSGDVVKVEADLASFINILGQTEKLIPVEHHMNKYMHTAANSFSSTNNNSNYQANNYQAPEFNGMNLPEAPFNASVSDYIPLQ